MKKIMLPIDGSETCERAFKTAAELADKFEAEILVFHVKPNVVPLSHPGMVAQEEHSDVHVEDVDRMVLQKAVDKLQAEGRVVHQMSSTGDPAGEIIDAAEKEGVDCIVMCTHGMGAVRRFFLGSVTNKVVHHATMNVLVVR